MLLWWKTDLDYENARQIQTIIVQDIPINYNSIVPERYTIQTIMVTDGLLECTSA